MNLRDGIRRAQTRPVQMGKSVVGQVRDDDVPFMAASIAYQAFVSLVPLLLLLFLVVAIVGDEALAERVVTLTEGFLPDAAQSIVRESIVGTTGGGAGSIIGLVVLVWGSLKIFRGLDKAFSEIYETESKNSFGDQLKDAAVVLVALGAGVVAVTVATSLFATIGGVFVGLLTPILLAGGLTLAFLPMYRRFPDTDLSWLDALPGAIIAGVGWTALQALFQVYISVSNKGNPSSVIGAILLLLTWLYFSGLLLLLAGVVNAVLLGESARSPLSDREPIEPEERISRLRAELDDERDRRQDAEADRDRLARELDRESSIKPAPPETVVDVRRENRLLRRRLRWLEKPLYVRAVLRLLGSSPPPAPEPADVPGDLADRGPQQGSGSRAD